MTIEVVNAFSIKELNEKLQSVTKPVQSVTVTVNAMKDYYTNRPEEVCNQWTEYIAVIIYN